MELSFTMEQVRSMEPYTRRYLVKKLASRRQKDTEKIRKAYLDILTAYQYFPEEYLNIVDYVLQILKVDIEHRKTLKCIYQTDDKPENVDVYNQIQTLGDIKEKAYVSGNKKLMFVVKIVENHFVYGLQYNVSEIRKLANGATDDEKEEFEKLISMLE